MKYYITLLLLCLIYGCGEKKIDLSGEVPVKPSDFIAAFPKISPPYSVADTNINKAADTVTIGLKAFTGFFPDSSLTNITGSNRKLTIHPVGKMEKEKENYYLLSFTGNKKTTWLAVFVTDKKNKYLAAKKLLQTGTDDDYIHSVSINREPTFLISQEKMNKENSLQYSRIGWVYTSSGSFMEIINDSNEDQKKNSVINPIDTLPRKNKFSGDYVQDKKNYISIRDSKKVNSYLFFIHFEKNEGSCTGELKGEMKMKDANTAQYILSGDPCVIDFRFEDNEITLKEKGSCGNHRGIKCYFDDTFTRKKESPHKKS